MKKNKNTLSYFNLIKAFLQSQLDPPADTLAAILFWAFRPFLEHRFSKQREKLKTYGYKVLDRFPKAGLQLLKMFILPIFQAQFRIWLAKGIAYHSNFPVQLWIDGTLLGDHYGCLIPEIKYLFDYVKKRYSKTHSLYFLVASIHSKIFILDFRFYSKKTKLGTNGLAIKMIDELVASLDVDLRESFLKESRLAMDGSWGNHTMLQYLSNKGFRRIALKSGGSDLLIDNFGEEMKLYEWQDMMLIGHDYEEFSFRPILDQYDLPGVSYIREVVRLKKTGQSAQLFLVQFLTENHPPRYLTLISLDISDWHAHQVIKTYLARWGVEVVIRTGKQNFDWGKMHFHIKWEPEETEWQNDETSKPITEPESFLDMEKGKVKRERRAMNRMEVCFGLHCMSLMVVNWYRIDCTRPTKTPYKEVLRRWQSSFDDLSPNAFGRLFSG